eukprot:4576331-Prymnesium_polylepis.1
MRHGAVRSWPSGGQAVTKRWPSGGQAVAKRWPGAVVAAAVVERCWWAKCGGGEVVGQVVGCGGVRHGGVRHGGAWHGGVRHDNRRLLRCRAHGVRHNDSRAALNNEASGERVGRRACVHWGRGAPPAHVTCSTPRAPAPHSSTPVPTRARP